MIEIVVIFADLLTQTQQMAESERALRGPDFTFEQLQEQQDMFSQGIQLMQEKKWVAAEKMWRRVINLADALPQPQGNLGISLLMQGQYDEAEAAFKRALEIEPDYDLAQRNLAMLPRIRDGETPDFALRNPFAEAKVGIRTHLVDDD